MTKKKILILTCAYPDAVNPNAHCFTYNQSLALKQAGYEVLVLHVDLRAFIRFRSFGLVCAEAILCGVPVTATDNGGSRDIITPQNGVFSKGSILEAASAIEYIITHKSAFDAYKMHAEAENRFGFNAFVKQISKVYNEVCTA